MSKLDRKESQGVERMMGGAPCGCRCLARAKTRRLPMQKNNACVLALNVFYYISIYHCAQRRGRVENKGKLEKWQPAASIQIRKEWVDWRHGTRHQTP